VAASFLVRIGFMNDISYHITRICRASFDMPQSRCELQAQEPTDKAVADRYVPNVKSNLSSFLGGIIYCNLLTLFTQQIIMSLVDLFTADNLLALLLAIIGTLLV